MFRHNSGTDSSTLSREPLGGDVTLSDLGAGVLKCPGLFCPSFRIKLHDEKVSIPRIGESEMFIRQPPEGDGSKQPLHGYILSLFRGKIDARHSQ